MTEEQSSELREISLSRCASLRAFVHDGDLLLFRRRGLISIAGRSPYSHAAMIGWWGHDPMLIEVVPWHGGRTVTLESQVGRYPGKYELFRPGEVLKPAVSVQCMRSLCDGRYGYIGVMHASMLHLPVIRGFVPASTDDNAISKRPPFCSQAISWAYRTGGGVDPVARLSDRITEPGDLARSTLFRSMGVLVP